MKFNPLFLSYLFNYYKKLNYSLKSCKLISISKYVHNLLLSQGFESETIPNALDVDKFVMDSKDSRDEDNENKDNKTKIVFLGSLTRFKGAKVLLQAINSNYRCDIYGEGIMKGELQKLIINNKLDTEIHKPLPYEKVAEIYHNADVVVFPSIWPEPFGRIAIEAMAAGKAVIGSDIGGIKETISTETGILVKPREVNELKNALEKLSKNKLLREQLGNKGREVVRNEYNEEKVVNKLIELYNLEIK